MQRYPGQLVSGTRKFARVRVITLTLLVVFIAPAPAAAAWRLPLSGPVSRAFSPGPNPYAGGHHRGVDLSAPPGSRVVAPCAGRVVVAGRVGSSGGVVTVLCGRWRASLLPLSTIVVRRGETVSARTPLGTLARSVAHAGLHVGVRRAGVRFGYVDPLRFFAASRPGTPPPLGRAPRGRPRAPLAAPATAPLAAPATAPLAAPATAPLAAPATEPLAAPLAPLAPPAPRPLRRLAPWPAWVGLALALAGLGVRWRQRRANALRLGGAAPESAGG
jgi:hypothetical protein